jgi:hypothetical protein
MDVCARVTSFTKGFYPVGRGRLQVLVEPQIDPIRPISLVRQGRVMHVKAVIWGTGFLGEEGDMVKARLKEELRVLLKRELAPYISADTPVTVWEDPVSVDCTMENENENVEHHGDAHHGDAISGSGTGKATSSDKHSSGKQPFKGRGGGRDSRGKGRGYSDQRKPKYSMLGCQLWCETDTGSIPCANGSAEVGGSNRDKMAGCIDPASLAGQVVARLAGQLSSGACVDEHTADQLLVFMAAAAAPLDTATTGAAEVLHDTATTATATTAAAAAAAAAVTTDITAGTSSVLCEPYHERYSSRHIETAIDVIEKLYNALCQSGRRHVTCKFSILEVGNGCRLIECKPVVFIQRKEARLS